MVIAIEIVSDLMCPWCFIGEHRLTNALAARPSLSVEVSFTPFLLDPGLGPEGADLRARLEKKYGVPAERLFGRVEAVSREAGVPIDFSKIRRAPSTLGGHVLLAHAAERGTQVALARALFRAYFQEGRDLGDPEVLGDVAAQHGFARGEAITLAGDEAERAKVRATALAQPGRGVSGVPHFVVGERFVVPGAQDEATWAKVLDRVAAG